MATERMLHVSLRLDSTSYTICSLDQPICGTIELLLEGDDKETRELVLTLHLEIEVQGYITRSHAGKERNRANVCSKAIVLHDGSMRFSSACAEVVFETTFAAMLNDTSPSYTRRQDNVEWEQETPIPPVYIYECQSEDYPYTIATRYHIEVKLRAPNITVQQRKTLVEFAYAMPAVLVRDVPKTLHLLVKHYQLKTAQLLPEQDRPKGLGLFKKTPTWTFDISLSLPRYLALRSPITFEVFCATDRHQSTVSTAPKLVMLECELELWEEWLDRPRKASGKGEHLLQSLSCLSEPLSFSPATDGSGRTSLILGNSAGFPARHSPSFNSPGFAVVHWLRIKMVLWAAGRDLRYHSWILPVTILSGIDSSIQPDNRDIFDTLPPS